MRLLSWLVSVSIGGGVYHPILRRLETFSDEPLRFALKHHEKRASMVLDLEEKVATVVKKLKERGLVSPYLRSFVVARINPLRWIKGELPSLEHVPKTMRERVIKFNLPENPQGWLYRVACRRLIDQRRQDAARRER